MHENRVLLLYLAVLELALEHLLGEESLFDSSLLERQSDLRLGTRGLDNREPLLTRLLVRRGEDLHLVATLQLVADGHHLAVDAPTSTLVAQLGVDMVGKVEHRGTYGELPKVTGRREHEHLVFVEIHLELVHGLHALRVLEHRADTREPLVEASLALHALIAPVGSHTALGNLVHALGTYLHLHPLLLRTQDGDVERLVAIRLRHAEPVAQALGIGLIHIGDDRIGLPALHLLLLFRTVDDDADGEEVVYALEAALLLVHLLPDAVDRLRAALDVTVDTRCLHLLRDRLDEPFDIGIARSLCLVELLADHVVGIVLHILQREVFELALQLVESELMGQGSIEIGSLLRHLHLRLDILRVADLAHQVHTVGNHDEDHAHVLCKRKKQVAEVLALDDGILLVELLDAVQTMKDTRHLRAILCLHLLYREVAFLYLRYQVYSLDGITLQADFLFQDFGRLSCHFLLFFVCKSKQICHISTFYGAKLQFSWNLCAFFRKS